MSDREWLEIDVSVTGHADDIFAPIENIFGRMVGSERNAGTSLAIYHRGRKKVDLVGGTYLPETLQAQFSVSKAVTAITAAHAASAQRLDLDQPMSTYWPAFDRASTKMISARMVLNHTSGLAGISRRLTIEQLVGGEYLSEIERQEPFWEPGTIHGYHAFSFGPLMDGVFERAVGETVGEYFDRNIRLPLDLDVWFGLPASEAGRISPYTRASRATTSLLRSLPTLREFADEGSRVLGSDPRFINRADVLTQGWPNCNVVATSRDLARLFAATMGDVEGSRVLDADALTRMIRPEASGVDWVLRFPIAFGSGVQLPFPQLPFTGASCFGHEGAGGCVVFADRDREMAVAFSTNAFPACDGAGPAFLALLSSIRYLADEV